MTHSRMDQPTSVPSTGGVAVFALGLILTLGLQTCALPTEFGADTRDKVEAGLSLIQVSKAVFLENGAAKTKVASGVSVTALVSLLNPQGVDVVSTLKWNLSNEVFSVLPPSAPQSQNTTSMAFSFVLGPQAEHQTLTFTLGMTVPSTGKSYPETTFSVLCDSPPNPAENLVAGQTAANQAFIAFTLPANATDDDLATVTISYQDVADPNKLGPLLTQTLAVNSGDLLVPVNPDPLAEEEGSKRYFAPTDVTPGDAYAFTVTLTDQGGQTSVPTSAGAEAISFTISYLANGGSGEVPSVVYDYGSLATLASTGFSREGYVLSGWNTQADGFGTAYALGAPVTMTLGNLALFAQWSLAGTVSVSFGWGSFGALTISGQPSTVGVGSVLSFAGPAGAQSWAWYFDGVLVGSSAVYSFTTTAAQVGTHNLSLVAVDSQGVGYSASTTVTVIATAAVSTQFSNIGFFPAGIVVDSSGNFLVANPSDNRVYRITPAGVVSIFAGSGVAGTDDHTDGLQATFYGPYGLAIDAADNLFVSDYFGNAIRKITPAGSVTTVLASAGLSAPSGLAVGAEGKTIYAADRLNNRIVKIDWDGVTAQSGVLSVLTSGLTTPDSVAFDNTGTILYVGDNSSGYVRKINFSAPSTAEYWAYLGNYVYGVTVDAAGSVYANVLTDTRRIFKITASGSISVFAGTGALGATDGEALSVATLNDPFQLVLHQGTLYFTERNSQAIRKVR